VERVQQQWVAEEHVEWVQQQWVDIDVVALMGWPQQQWVDVDDALMDWRQLDMPVDFVAAMVGYEEVVTYLKKYGME
jgi:hypothetical protein